MQIKRFTARTMSEALQMVKAELGPDAIILSARSIRKNGLFFDSFRKAGVEVTAAQDTAAYGSYPQSAHDGISPQPSVLSLKRKRTGMAAERQSGSAAGGNRAPAAGSRRSSDGSDRDDALRESWLYRHLVGQEVRREYALEITSELLADPAAGEFAEDRLATALGRAFRKMGASTRAIVSAAAKRVAFVGPSGVGKTASAAKLAAVHAMNPGRRVAIITLDNYRVAATDQLQRCADIIGIPLFAAAQPEELRLALSELEGFDLILIDTPALRPADRGMLKKLSEDLRLAAAEEIHLVCSATRKEKDTVELFKTLKGVPVNRLLFTKLDETASYGSLVNILIRLQIPASGFSGGQKIPDSLRDAAVEQLAGLILNARNQAAADAPLEKTRRAKATFDSRRVKRSAAVFTANKNSNLFHTADCMWTRLIKKNNRVFFPSAAEALARQFKPCRDCCRQIAEQPEVRRWG